MLRIGSRGYYLRPCASGEAGSGSYVARPAPRGQLQDVVTLTAAGDGGVDGPRDAQPVRSYRTFPPFNGGFPALATRSSRVQANGRKRRSCSPV